jgi:hypothetical protein
LCLASHLFCRIFGVDDSKHLKKETKKHRKSKNTSNKRFFIDFFLIDVCEK